MYKNEFDKLLNTKKIPNSVLFFGDSRYLVEKYLKKTLEILPQDAEVLKFYNFEYDYKLALEHLASSSLFASTNILIIKTEKKILKKECQALIDAASKNNAYFLLEYYAENAKDLSTVFVPKNSALNVRFFEPNLRESLIILKEEASKLNLDISEHALHHLLNTYYNNIEIVINELEKFSILDTKIDTKLIDSFVHGGSEVSMQEMFDLLLSKKDYKKHLNFFIESGEEEVNIINALQRYVTQLAMFAMSVKIFGNTDSKNVLGYKLPRQIEEKRFSLSIRLNSKKYFKILQILSKAELEIKTQTSIPKKAFLISTFIQIEEII